jgi:hypothetical protein
MALPIGVRSSTVLLVIQIAFIGFIELSSISPAAVKKILQSTLMVGFQTASRTLQHMEPAQMAHLLQNPINFVPTLLSVGTNLVVETVRAEPEAPILQPKKSSTPSIEQECVEALSSSISEKNSAAPSVGAYDKVRDFKQADLISRLPNLSSYRRQMVDERKVTTRADVLADSASRKLLSENVGFVEIEKLKRLAKATGAAIKAKPLKVT